MQKSRHLLYPSGRSPRRQPGFALVIALIFLLLITLLAFSASQYALLQQRMAGSLRNAQQASMSAETALRGAEYKIWSIARQPGVYLHCQDGSISPDDGCIIYRPLGSMYAANGNVTTFQTAPGWLTNIGVSYTGPTHRGYIDDNGQAPGALAKNPVYIIEDLGIEQPPGGGSLHESGNTGPNNGGPDHLDIHIYRITARATGGNPNVVSVLQSTFDAPASP